MTTLPAVLGGAPAFPDGLPLVRPSIRDQAGLERKLAAVLASGALTNGPTVRRLEQAVAERLDVPHVVAVASCTSGLALTYQALGVRGEVVLPSFTFSASAHAVHWAGGTPRWAEVTVERLTLDPADAAARTDAATAAISATHVYGAPAQVEELERLAAERGVPLVLDAAHALGSVHRGRPVGGFGTAEVFSLSPTKVLVGGEGGLVATRDADLAARLRIGRDYGNPGDYDCRFAGLNARMSELHATLALHNLAHLDEAVAHRGALAQQFLDAVDGLPGVRAPLPEPGDVSTHKDLTVLVDEEVCGLDAIDVGTALRAEGIDTRRYYHPPVHRQLAYRDLPATDLPVTDRLCQQVLSLPLWSHMTPQAMASLAEAFRRVLRHAPEVSARLPRLAADRVP